MSIFKCKMCGGTLEINSETVATCEYCGTQQTLPKLDDERRANLYDRANHFRRNNEFDKAMGIYEQILNEDNTDAESYWSLVLCRYGIEYVEDPATHKRVPTVNRAQFTSIFDDDNYKAALSHADGYQKTIYEAEARAINEIQKGILAISQKEEPFDVFICYKETDNSGRRTPDSVLANDLYHQLTQEGFKVFFSRITLEDKLGTAYEPYIFAALNSAKVMVVLGTKPEYFKAVWVRNEWSRYLSRIKGGAKKVLIPAYKDMDPYDLPDEFSHLQAQDMSKLGFMQDLIRGVRKILDAAPRQKTTVVKETIVTSGSANTAPLLRRVFMFLEDENWDSADEYCEKVLDMDPENVEAYLGKLMAELKVRRKEGLQDCAKPFDDKNNYQKVLRFGKDALKSELTGYIDHINTRNENSRKDAILAEGKAKITGMDISNYEAAIKLFESISGWKDADEQIHICNEKIAELNAKAEAERLARERQAELARVEEEKRRKKTKKTLSIVLSVIAVCIVAVLMVTKVVKRNNAIEKFGKEFVITFENLEVGDTFVFGAYEQDNDTSNGEEKIEWIVLAKKYNRVLVISKYALDHQPYNTEFIKNLTWENCSLREWLNSEFINNAFSIDEQEIISEFEVSSSGNSEQDQVFLLSRTGAERYFSSDEARMCTATDYAIAQGASSAGCAWFVSAPSYSWYDDGTFESLPREVAATLDRDISVSGNVRPALWINLQ